MTSSPNPERAGRSLEPGSRFCAIYEAHFDYLWTNLRRMGVSGPDLDDAVQETFLVVFRRWDALQPDRSPRAWLFGIARRIASRYRRGRDRRQRLLVEVAPTLDAARDAEGELTRRQAARLVQAFVDRLDDRKRDVFVLAEIEGFTRVEIAQALGVSPNTVGSRIRAARHDFERYLQILRACERGASARLERRAILRGARAAQPPATARRRIRAVLWLRLGAPAGTRPVPGGGAAAGILPSLAVAASLGVATVGLGVGLGGGLGVLGGSGPVGVEASSSEKARRVTVESRVEGTSESAASSPAVAPVGPGRALAVAGDGLVATGAAPPRGGARRSTRRPATGVAAERTGGSLAFDLPVRDGPAPIVEPIVRRGRDHDAPRGSAADGFAEEIRLVTRLRRAVKAGELRPALALARRHERRFRSGALTHERQSLQIAVLCRLDRHAEAVALVGADRSGAVTLAAECPGIEQRSTKAREAGEEPGHASWSL